MSYTARKVDFENDQGKPSNFIRLREGSNIIRIVSSSYWVRRHSVNKFGKILPVNCKGANCELCAEGKSAPVRFLAIVLDRLVGEVGVIDLPGDVGSKILSLGRKEDIRTVDIEIIRKGTGKDTKYTDIKKVPTKEVTDEERSNIHEAKPILEKKYLDFKNI